MNEFTRSVRAGSVALVIILALGVEPLVAVPDRLLQAVPVDALAVGCLDGSAVGSSSATPTEMLLATVGRLREMGLVKSSSRTTGMILDMAEAWPLIRRYPRAYVLHDIGLEPLPTGGSRLSKLALSLILHTGQDDHNARRFVQQFLARYTNDQQARLEKIDRQGFEFHRLVDTSLPDWAVWDWGRAGDLFIISIGQGATDKILQTTANHASALLADEWFAPAHHHTEGTSAALELFLRTAELRSRLGTAAADRVSDFVAGLGLESFDKSLWTARVRDGALTCAAYHRQGGADRLEYIAAPPESPTEFQQLIPAGATWHAIIRKDAAALFRSLRMCFLASYRLEKRLELFNAWDQLMQNRAVDVESDILSQLGDHIIVHNYPQHPLGLPVMCTILVEIKGDSRRVQQALAAVLDYCSLRMDLAASNQLTPVLAPALRHADDGVWNLQYGINGPALAVTQGWLVLSYSPDALRANLASPSSSPSPPTTQPSAISQVEPPPASTPPTPTPPVNPPAPISQPPTTPQHD